MLKVLLTDPRILICNDCGGDTFTPIANARVKCNSCKRNHAAFGEAVMAVRLLQEIQDLRERVAVLELTCKRRKNPQRILNDARAAEIERQYRPLDSK